MAPGLQMRRALSLCPDAVVLPPDHVLYGNRWRSVLDALDLISPEVEDEAPGRAREELSGMLADTLRDAGHVFLKGVGADGTRVGWLWVTPAPALRDASSVVDVRVKPLPSGVRSSARCSVALTRAPSLISPLA